MNALLWAAQEGHEACVVALLAAGADPQAAEEDGHTALMFAAMYNGVQYKGHEACVAALLRK